jgi:cyclopropane fatty-acyl-phospholipid synthase-like methyltransferase
VQENIFIGEFKAMNKEYDYIFKQYVNKLISPDGKETFESTKELTERIIKNAEFKSENSVIDIGSGWGNNAIPISELVKNVIGIEPDKKNIEEALKRTEKENIENIQYIKGSFENLHYKGHADRIISSLAFHQIKHGKRGRSIKNIKKCLLESGRFILCDTLMFFNPEKEQSKFNEVYRYLLPITTPVNIYEKYIKPYMEDDSYQYSWEDMKKYTPKNNWYYSIGELEEEVEKNMMKIVNIDELAPFFGIVSIENK